MSGREERKPYERIIGTGGRPQDTPVTPPPQPAAASVPRHPFERIIGYREQRAASNAARQASEPPPRGPDDTAEIPRVKARPIDAFKRRWERRRDRPSRSTRRESPLGWRTTVIPEMGNVPEADLRHCQSLLVEDVGGQREDIIYYLSHYHPFKSIERVTPAILAMFLGVILFFGSIAYRVSGSYGYTDSQGKPHTLMPWYWPPVIGLVLVVVGAVAYYFLRYGWRYQFIMITNTKLRLLNAFPPKNSLILKNMVDNNDLNRVESVDIDQTRWGKIFNYGNLMVQLVGADPDKPKVLEMVAEPFKIASLLESVSGAHHRAPREVGDLME